MTVRNGKRDRDHLDVYDSGFRRSNIHGRCHYFEANGGCLRNARCR